MQELNSAYIDDIYFAFLQNPNSVSTEWQEYFKNEKFQTLAIPNEIKYLEPTLNKTATENSPIPQNSNPLDSVGQKIAANMAISLEVPTATTFRTIPAKALEENRTLINEYLFKKISYKVTFSQLISWAIVRALIKFPRLKDSIELLDGKYYRIKRTDLNLGIAIDVKKKDGSRSLVAPNIKSCEKYNFKEFIDKYDALINNAKINKLALDDFSATTLTFTNPGGMGTNASSARLMKGQSMIIAAGALDYPNEFKAMAHDTLHELRVGKILTLTNTYDHRFIQGAESAEFLSYISELLAGEHRFYDQIFASLKIPFAPYSLKESSDPNECYESKALKVAKLINAYRTRGHLIAQINPLGYDAYQYPELELSYYNFSLWNLDDKYLHLDLSPEKEITLREVLSRLRSAYTGSIGIEYGHLQKIDRRDWLKQKVETKGWNTIFTKDEQIKALTKIIDAENFENFLQKKFVGHKRFSLEGGECLISAIDKLLELTAKNDLCGAVIAMSHRGRLYVLANNVGKPLEDIFNEFEGVIDQNAFFGSGDVKYHKGDTEVQKADGYHEISVTLAPNPSHLEIVAPVALGIARAKCDEVQDKTYSEFLPIIIHGDSAFAGQGVVYETFNLSRLQNYKTSGAIHIIVNNQIGFTTSPEDARAGIYCTEGAKSAGAPILHINGNDVNAVLTGVKLAFEYRELFHSDIVLDILCYRKYGHNEGDEPSFTQPLLYKKIKLMPLISSLYSNHLINNGIEDISDINEININSKKYLEDSFNNRNKIDFTSAIINNNEIVDEKIGKNAIQKVGVALTIFPNDFTPNAKALAILNKRKLNLETGENIDWAFAELLALGTLSLENKRVRFSGQDARRGTFNQRHAELVDFLNESRYSSLNNISSKQTKIQIFDSPLTELAALGFEFGYSLYNKNGITLWEAQFGDFFNMAQPIIDQFIVCSESKWGERNNLTLLLPHGYDGQGAEHSSARIERFLELCAENNMSVAYPTAPAQYFHLLREQALSSNRKPLIVFTPKSALRHHKAVSKLKDFTDKSFIDVLDYEGDKSSVKKIALCAGKVYYEADDYKDKISDTSVALIRIERLYPLNFNLIDKILSKYSAGNDIIWLQEEPKNMGAYSYIKLAFLEKFGAKYDLEYIGRKASASPATGNPRIHEMEKAEIFSELFGK